MTVCDTWNFGVEGTVADSSSGATFVGSFGHEGTVYGDLSSGSLVLVVLIHSFYDALDPLVLKVLLWHRWSCRYCV